MLALLSKALPAGSPRFANRHAILVLPLSPETATTTGDHPQRNRWIGDSPS